MRPRLDEERWHRWPRRGDRKAAGGGRRRRGDARNVLLNEQIGLLIFKGLDWSSWINARLLGCEPKAD